MHTFGGLCRVEGRGEKDFQGEFCTSMAVLCSILDDFGADFRFRKHAPAENGNAKFFFGVDFFEPSKGFLWHIEANQLKASCLTNPLKTRVFSAKSFLVENFRNMRVFSRFWEASVLIYFNFPGGLASVMIKKIK
jgi:hypothetical protein